MKGHGQPWGRGMAATVRALLDEEAEPVQPPEALVTLVGLHGVGKSTLYNWLHGGEVSPAPSQEPTEERLGLFALADVLPEETLSVGVGAWQNGIEGMGMGMAGQGYGGYMPADSGGLLSILDATVLIYVVDGAAGVSAAEWRWGYRLRALRRPLLVVITRSDVVAEGEIQPQVAELRRRLAVPVVAVSGVTGAGLLDHLLPTLVRLCPALTTALGREVPAFRATAARRVQNQAALSCAVLGLEPVPLLDTPFQLLVEMRQLRELGQLYGQEGFTGLRPEVVAALMAVLTIRYGAQMALKSIPIAGWVACAIVSGGGSWLIGWAAQQYFAALQTGEGWTRPAWSRPRWQRPRGRRIRLPTWRRTPTPAPAMAEMAAEPATETEPPPIESIAEGGIDVA